MEKLKIYGTIGPACADRKIMEEMFKAGMTGMRLNLSHVDLSDCIEWLEEFHWAAANTGIIPELLIDMKGPELRIGKLQEPVLLENNTVVDTKRLLFPDIVYPYLKKGTHILLDDGNLLIEISDDEGKQAKVLRGGKLTSSKSIAIEGVSVPSPTLTEADMNNLKEAYKYAVTGIMQPFVRNAEDLKNVREALDSTGNEKLKIFAKIENQAGVDQIHDLLPHCDEIIIARGDLGNAVGLTRLPSVQHYLEKVCQEHNKPYMVVTQMLHSMHNNAVPTRAEVSDIYHAVYNGASSIMLTGETAAGKYPIEAMRYFVDTAKEALKDRESGY